MSRSMLQWGKRTEHSEGFTLIELLISMAVVTVVTTVILLTYNDFDDSIVLTNTAYELGLSVREAQVYGVSVRESESRNTFAEATYGIHFNVNTPREYVLFEDENSDRRYNSGEAVLRRYQLARGARISRICVRQPSRGGAIDCSDNSGNSFYIDRLDVTFKRPSPEARVMAHYPNGFGWREGDHARIELSPAGSEKTRTVQVNRVGNISVSEQ